MKNPIYSIILPIYNQEEQVRDIIEDYSKSLINLHCSFELILVINGSSDKSFEVAKKISNEKKFLKIFKIREEGWGRAVRYGINKSNGQLICYTNSARTNTKDLIKILLLTKNNSDTLVKASRIIRESFIRKVGSTIYNIECRFLFKTPIWDVNGTPKVFPRKIINKIKLSSNGDLIDAELISTWVKLGYSILEFPVFLNKRRGGKSTTTILSGIKMYINLFRMRNKI